MNPDGRAGAWYRHSPGLLPPEALEALHGSDPGPVSGLIAHHFLEGSLPARAKSYAFRAGQRAADLAAWVELQPTFRFHCSDLPVSGRRKLSCQVSVEGRISDPEKSVLNVPNLETALGLVGTKLIEPGHLD